MSAFPSAVLAAARAEALPFPGEAFDAAVAVAVLEFADMEAALRRLARVLRPGGRAVVALRNGRAPTSPGSGVSCSRSRAPRCGRPPSARRLGRAGSARCRPPARRLLAGAGLVVERVELAGCAVLPAPVDRVAPGLAHAAARRAEGSQRVRRVLGTHRLLLVVRR